MRDDSIQYLPVLRIANTFTIHKPMVVLPPFRGIQHRGEISEIVMKEPSGDLADCDCDTTDSAAGCKAIVLLSFSLPNRCCCEFGSQRNPLIGRSRVWSLTDGR